MPSKKLTREKIAEAALALTAESADGSFSLRELAHTLGVKASSLYNHYSGFEEIQQEVALRVSALMNKALGDAIAGREQDEAFLAGADAYRKFADENRGLYTALIRMPSFNDEKIRRASRESYAPLRAVIRSYGKEKDATIHFNRAFRSAMHGFVELTANQFMQRGAVKKDETYRLMVRGYLNYLKGLPENEKV